MNVAALLTKAATAYPDRVALRCGTRRVTYAELDRAASRFGLGLLTLGLGRGDRVALYARNSAEYVITLLGTLRAGLAAVPVNEKLHPNELSYILQDSGARALAYGEEKTAEARAAAAGLDGVALVPLGEGPTTGGPLPADADVEPGALAWLFYTSGTTGRPKGAMLTHRNLIAMTVNCLADVCSFQPEDVVLHAAPLSHGSGLYLLGSLARGAENLIWDEPRFDPDHVLATLARERVTVIAFLAPTMIVRLLDADPSLAAPTLRRVVYGGAPIHAEHARAALRRFGRVFVQIYGMGESPMTISYLRAEDHDPDDLVTLASAGLPRTDVEVRIVGDDDRDVPVGAEGEVVVRGDVVMPGYWQDEGASAHALRGGWLHTGDIGRFDDRGRLFLLDRKHDMIISGGANIYPREVEEALVRHEAVAEAAVFGIPDREWGESVVAAVVPAAGALLDPDDLVRFCREQLASYKKPSRVVTVEALPKNAYGKVLRRELRDQYIQEETVR